MRPFFMPAAYQSQANALPGAVSRSSVAYAGGQNQHMAAEQQAAAANMHQNFNTTPGRGSWGGYNVPGQGGNPVEGMVGAYSMGVKAMPGDVARSQMLNFSGLGRVSGSMMREIRRSPSVHGALGSGIDPSAFGSGSGTLGLGATVYANVNQLSGRSYRDGAIRLGSTSGLPWYENPWYLGGGAAVIIGAVWYLTRKKR